MGGGGAEGTHPFYETPFGEAYARMAELSTATHFPLKELQLPTPCAEVVVGRPAHFDASVQMLSNVGAGCVARVLCQHPRRVGEAHLLLLLVGEARAAWVRRLRVGALYAWRGGHVSTVAKLGLVAGPNRALVSGRALAALQKARLWRFMAGGPWTCAAFEAAGYDRNPMRPPREWGMVHSFSSRLGTSIP